MTIVLPTIKDKKPKLTNDAGELRPQINFVQCLDERRRVIEGLDSDDLPLPNSLDPEYLTYEASEDQWLDEAQLGNISFERAIRVKAVLKQYRNAFALLADEGSGTL